MYCKEFLFFLKEMLPYSHLFIVPFSSNLFFNAFVPWEDKTGPALLAEAPLWTWKPALHQCTRAPRSVVFLHSFPANAARMSVLALPASNSFLCVYKFAFYSGLS